MSRRILVSPRICSTVANLARRDRGNGGNHRQNPFQKLGGVQALMTTQSSSPTLLKRWGMLLSNR